MVEAGSPPEQSTRPIPRAEVARLAAGAALAFLAAWALVTWLMSIGIYGDPDSAADVGLYEHWGREVLIPRVPYLDFGIEYPPLGVAIVVLPAIIAGAEGGEDAYRLAFQLLMAACGAGLAAATVATIAALGGRRRELLVGGGLVVAFPLLLGPLVLARYDLWPALLTALALLSLATRRLNWAAVFIGLGTLAKLYPLLLAPFVLAWIWRRDGPRNAVGWPLVLAFVLLLGFGPFLGLAPQQTVDMVLRTLERPLQVEAFGAVIIMLIGEAAGIETELVHTFDSWNLEGPAPDAIASVQTLLSAGLLALVLVGFLRSRPSRRALVVSVTAAMCAYVAFGKVFSPQYVTWLMPFVALLPAVGGGQLGVGLLAGATLLTSLYYPANYWPFVSDRDLLWTLVVLARNVLLVVLALDLVGSVLARRQGAGGTAPGDPEAGTIAASDAANTRRIGLSTAGSAVPPTEPASDAAHTR